jgi:uncharacterized protein (TIGR03437 family)
MKKPAADNAFSLSIRVHQRSSAAMIAFLHRDGPRVRSNNPALRRTYVKKLLYSSAKRIMRLFLATILAATAFSQPALIYIPGSSVKLYQVNGDCDWAVWDSTMTNKTPTCKPTTSQTATKADVLGNDVPVAFEHNGELIVTFGDTIGAVGYSNWTSVQNSFQWGAHDPIARSTTQNASDGLLLNFFLNGNHGLEVAPPGINMGPDNIPNAGVSFNGTIYLGIKTGSVSMGAGNIDQSNSYSVLATFNETTQTFTTGRTISSLPNGHFASPTFYLTPGILGAEPGVLIFGMGRYRASNIYLSTVPASQFASGTGTQYFAGLNNGQPVWSSNESSAVPVVNDIDPANPTVGNVTVFYSQPLGLWLMMFDGGRGSPSTNGMYFTYAPQPWGPWSAPQMVFNGCRDKALGNFIYYYYATAAGNSCPSVPNSSGPAGPTIGDQTVNNPNTTRGGAYAPTFVERFTVISGSTLKLFYMFSTWNPYAVVMMESDFSIATGPVITEVANAEGESPAIAPNTWLEIKGVNLAPDTRTWQTSDFNGTQMPAQIDRVGVTVNGKNAYVYYISPTQVNILTPPDAISGPVQVVLTNNGISSASFTAQAQSLSPSFFVFNGGPYVAATHLNGSLIGPVTLYPGSTTPAAGGETIVLYANGFGPTNVPIVSGSSTQSGTLSPLPSVTIGGVKATVQFAGLVAPGEYQFNVVVPSTLAKGDQPITASYNGQSTQPGTLLTLQ